MASLIGSRKISGGGTSSALNTTAATLFVAFKSGGGSFANPTDSQGNTWTRLTQIQPGYFSDTMAIYYVIAPSVSASHTFTDAADSASLFVLAFDGGPWTYTQQSTSSSSGSPGSLTASGDGALYVTGGIGGSPFPTPPPTVSDGFTLDDYNNTGGVYTGAIAYFLQGTAAAKNPTWAGHTSSPGAVMAVFVPAAPSTAIKTIMGLPYASVKTVMGLPIASVKTIQGLT